MPLPLPVRDYIDRYCQHPGNVKKHYDRLLEAGYYPVHMNRYVGAELHDWTEQNLGRPNYNWTGHVFWFNNKQDATLFALRWC